MTIANLRSAFPRRLLFVITCGLLGFSPAKGFDPGLASFGIVVDSMESRYRVMTYSLLPGDSLDLTLLTESAAAPIAWHSDQVKATEPAANRRQLHPPKTVGAYQGRFVAGDRADDTMLVNIFVLEPASSVKNGRLNGYRIGKYPAKPYKGLPQYLPPSGYIKATPELMEMKVSPHFTLGQFICKQNGGFPKYLVLRTELLLKLELVLHEVNKAGFSGQSFHVMSGYRTPYYNQAIGNVKHSRHQWGGAADIFIDEHPKDGVMDDLNKDGRINRHDAAVMYDLVEELYGEDWYQPFIGGLGRYRRTDSHGPFVHIDVRGFRARWGD